METTHSIQKRRGKVIVSRKIILGASENLLKTLFSTIYPIYVDTEHNIQHYDSIVYHCLSPLFEEVDEACLAPEYEIVVESKLGDVHTIVRVKKRIKEF